MSSSQPLIRIGELSRRLDVSADQLRAWERRYNLLQPARTSGGFRLYSTEDEHRVRAMQHHLKSGLSAAEAANAALADAAPPADANRAGIAELHEQLDQALAAFDATRAHALLDRLFAELPVQDALGAVIYPLLHELGERWTRAEINIGHEHFASSLLQARLLALLHSSSRGGGPLALLACAPAELHTLGLIGFGITLHNEGWRTTYLGADTPITSLKTTATQLTPAVTVLSASTPARFADVETQLRDLARATPLALAGAGANPELAKRVGALLLDANPVAAAASLTATHA